jgi:hypothetical protein
MPLESDMIRPEFRQILLDQRGAAVILWCFFFISVPIYILIARSLLGNPDLGTNRTVAEWARMIFWALTLVDIGYYFYWRERNLSTAAIKRDARKTKLFRALEVYQGAAEETAAYVVSTLVTRKVVIYAIIEALAVYGFTLAILGRFFQDQVILSFVSLVLLAIEFPSAGSLEKLFEEVEHSGT